MKKLLFALPLLVAAPLFAQMPTEAPGKPDASLVTGGTYAVDPGHTIVGWRLNHLGFNDYFGLFGEVEGTLVLDKADPSASKVDVTIPITSVSITSEGLKEHLFRAGKDSGDPDFFGPKPAPARFVSTSVVTAGDNAAILGNLSMNGVTKPVLINAEFTGAGTGMGGKENVGFEGSATIKRSDFGLDTAIPLVSDEVELTLTAAFVKQ